MRHGVMVIIIAMRAAQRCSLSPQTVNHSVGTQNIMYARRIILCYCITVLGAQRRRHIVSGRKAIIIIDVIGN